MAGLATFMSNGDRRTQGNAGLRTNLGSAAVQLDGAFQSNGGWAVQSGFAGRLLGTSYVFQHTEYGRDFIDELRSSISGSYRRDTQLRLDRGFRSWHARACNEPGGRTLRPRRCDGVEWHLPALLRASIAGWFRIPSPIAGSTAAASRLRTLMERSNSMGLSPTGAYAPRWIIIWNRGGSFAT